MKTWLLLGAFGLAGCSAAPPLSSAPSQQSIFAVIAQNQKQPTVVVGNQSDASLRLLLTKLDGTVLTLDVAPQSEGRLDVPKGHYEAKVFNVEGKVRSAYGSADIQEYKNYRTNFLVKQGSGYTFHIGGNN
jgi:hypothetical protein